MVATPMAVTTDGAWHGAVPAGWSLKQLKWAVTFQRGHDLPTEDRQEGSVPVITGGGITGWHNVAQARGPGIVTGRYGTIGEFYLIEQDYWPLNTSLYSIDLHGNHAGFLRYMLEPLAPLFHLNAAKSAVPGIDRSDIHTIRVAVPPLATQRAIADYLDRETVRLDALLAAKERLLRLVAEKRRALITRAVTRGIDPRIPLRQTKLIWPGHVPHSWEVVRLKWLVVSVESGVSVNATDQPAAPGELGVLKTSAVSGGLFFPYENKTVWASETDRVACPVRRDTVIMSRMNTPSLVAESGYVGRSYPDLFLPDRLWQLTFDSKRAFTPFMAKVLACAEARAALSEMATGTSGSMKNLAQEDMLSLLVPLPPILQQRAISAYIDAEIAKLDALRSATERTIALLKERRAALISAAVTGQIEVEGAA